MTRVSTALCVFFCALFSLSGCAHDGRQGLKTDFSAIDTSKIVFAIGFVIVAMISKIIGCGLVAKACKFKWMDCLKIGVGMMTRGEVALIITNKGLNMGIIDSSYFTAVILLIIISGISVPILLKMLYAKAPDPA